MTIKVQKVKRGIHVYTFEWLFDPKLIAWIPWKSLGKTLLQKWSSPMRPRVSRHGFLE